MSINASVTDENLDIDFLSEVDNPIINGIVVEPASTDGDANETPVAEMDTASTHPDTAVTVDVLANDSDPDGDALSVISVGAATAAQNGTTTLNSDGTVTYTPDAGYSGSDSFSYTVSDGNGGEATANVDISVAESMAFHAGEFSGYSGQDVDGEVALSDEGRVVSLTGNTWQKAEIASQEVTADTVLSFDFRVLSEGEGHAFGVDGDGTWDTGDERVFQLAGTSGAPSNSDRNSADYYGQAGSDWTSYEIPLGDYFTGPIENLAFINDDDVTNPDADSGYRNIHLTDNSLTDDPGSDVQLTGHLPSIDADALI
jgi:hypothetical protein